MNRVRRHGPRILVTLLPVLFMLLHAGGLLRLPLLDRLDHLIYDARLRATMPRTLDERIVIVDIDDPSLHALGQWPWGRDKLARLVTELVDRQQVAALGFDVLFVEADDSSGLPALRALAQGPLRDDVAFQAALQTLAPTLDHDSTFARAMAHRPVALGYYFTRLDAARPVGQLPPPLLPAELFRDGLPQLTAWHGFGASIEPLARAASATGFLNIVVGARDDGVVRAVPLLANYTGTAAQPGIYESLALAVHRLALGGPRTAAPVFAPQPGRPDSAPKLVALVLGDGAMRLRVPLSADASMHVPFRGPGGARGGSFRYLGAAEVLGGQLPAGALRGKVVLVGSTAPGLQDLRTTPVGAAFPGVEVHANLVSALLDQRFITVPDYAAGYEWLMDLLVGLALAIGLSLWPVGRAVLLAGAVGLLVVGLNLGLYLQSGLAMPLASTLATLVLAIGANLGWGYFVDARASRSLAALFGTYVPRQLVEQMRADPARYTMRAESKALTVMFCDLRGFTRLSETMHPEQLQELLNALFSRLTEIISRHLGTVDKYMGDCVMAFWGAPVELPDHAGHAVRAALEMAQAVRELDAAQRAGGGPGISVGIGLNTGVMSVGDMGSAVRRSYTVVGDAVNLAARLERLGQHYGVEIVATEATRAAAPQWHWRELDRVRVRGRAQAVRIFSPAGDAHAPGAGAMAQELAAWHRVLDAYRQQRWNEARARLEPLLQADAQNFLYRHYAQRLASLASLEPDPAWDDATRFDSK